jgi:hypothetical protein
MMVKITFNVNNGPDISFCGKEIAYAHDPSNDLAYRVYETQKGHWLIAATSDENVLVQHIVVEDKSTDKLVEKLGYSDFSKSIYEQLSIDTAQHLDI